MNKSSKGRTVRLTVAQAVVTYLSRQYSVADGRRRRLVPAALGIFGHGNVAGIGQALDQLSDALPFIQGRNEQALTALPQAMRTLTDPVDTGAVVLALPQDIQSHAYDYPAELFAERDWTIRRPPPDPGEVEAVAGLLAKAERPLIIAGGGVVYAGATPELEALAAAAGVPVAETFAGKGAVQQRAWWQLGGIGLEGTPATNDLAREADLVLTVGSRLTDFATASQSLFQHPEVRFASINLNPYDAGRLGATGIVADAKRALAALTEAVGRAGISSPADWQERVRVRNRQWQTERAAALDPH